MFRTRSAGGYAVTRICRKRPALYHSYTTDSYGRNSAFVKGDVE
jgi:hypothetical protein